MSSFQGIWVPLVTPFRHGEIDFAALPRLLDHLLNAGVAGVVVCGTTGEAAHLHPQRFVALHRQVVEGRLEAARANFFALLPLIRAAFAEPNPAPVKAGLARQGLIGDELRAPLLGCGAALAERLGSLLAEIPARLA